MSDVRLVNRFTGSVVVVSDEKAAGLATLGFEPEKSTTAKKSTAKKTSSSSKK